MSAFQRAEKLPKPKLGEMFTDVWAVKKGEEAPAVIVSPCIARLTIVGAESGTGKAVEEVWRGVDALERWPEAVRREWRRRHGLRWPRIMSVNNEMSRLASPVVACDVYDARLQSHSLYVNPAPQKQTRRTD